MPSFAISKFTVLLEPLWVSAEFLLLSTSPNLDGSQSAVLSTLLVIQLSGIVISPPNFPKEHKKERCDHFSVAALLHYISWCASDYSVVGRISCHVPYDNIGINVCQRSFAEFFLAAADSESNGFYQ